MSNNKINYKTHIQSIGWQNYVKDGETAGTTGQSKRLEAICIKLADEVKGGVTYCGHIQTSGWENYWAKDGEQSGCCGQARRYEAIQIKLTGEASNKYDVWYRVHCESFGWLGWAKNGEKAGSEGYGYRMEAIEIKLVAKGGTAPTPTGDSFKKYEAQKPSDRDAKVQSIRNQLANWSDPRNQGYRGLCQAFVTDIYRNAGLNATSYCCANANRDTNAKGGNPENGDIVFSGTNYHNEACGVCPREAGHVAIYMDGYACGAQTTYRCPWDVWVASFGYGGHSNYGNW